MDISIRIEFILLYFLIVIVTSNPQLPKENGPGPSRPKPNITITTTTTIRTTKTHEKQSPDSFHIAIGRNASGDLVQGIKRCHLINARRGFDNTCKCRNQETFFPEILEDGKVVGCSEESELFESELEIDGKVTFIKKEENKYIIPNNGTIKWREKEEFTPVKCNEEANIEEVFKGSWFIYTKLKEHNFKAIKENHIFKLKISENTPKTKYDGLLIYIRFKCGSKSENLFIKFEGENSITGILPSYFRDRRPPPPGGRPPRPPPRPRYTTSPPVSDKKKNNDEDDSGGVSTVLIASVASVVGIFLILITIVVCYVVYRHYKLLKLKERNLQRSSSRPPDYYADPPPSYDEPLKLRSRQFSIEHLADNIPPRIPQPLPPTPVDDSSYIAPSEIKVPEKEEETDELYTRLNDVIGSHYESLSTEYLGIYDDEIKVKDEEDETDLTIEHKV